MGKKDLIKNQLHDKELVQKLWQMFRIGQTTYVAYVIGLINFTLILYRLAGIDQHIEPLPFAIILIVILGPLGVIIGILHVRKQIPVESKIMAHHNPYVYKIVQHSKESMATKAAIWQQDVGRVMNDFMKIQINLDKKILKGLSEVTGKELLTKEDEKNLDKINEHLDVIREGIDNWQEKYEQLSEGKEIKDIPNAHEYPKIEDKKNE